MFNCEVWTVVMLGGPLSAGFSCAHSCAVCLLAHSKSGAQAALRYCANKAGPPRTRSYSVCVAACCWIVGHSHMASLRRLTCFIMCHDRNTSRASLSYITCTERCRRQCFCPHVIQQACSKAGDRQEHAVEDAMCINNYVSGYE